MKDELKMFRVYGERGLETYDEYCWARNAQNAADRVREWHSNDGSDESDPPFKVIEVAKVMRGWK